MMIMNKGLHIHFNKGEKVHLDGEGAEQFLGGERIMMVAAWLWEI